MCLTLVRAARFLDTDPNALRGFNVATFLGGEDPLRPKGREGVEVLRLFNSLQNVRSCRAVFHLLRGAAADEDGNAELPG
jgi:hypothetical protein